MARCSLPVAPWARAGHKVRSHSQRLPLGRELSPPPQAEPAPESPALWRRHPIRRTLSANVSTKAFEYDLDLSHLRWGCRPLESRGRLNEVKPHGPAAFV